MTSGFVRFNQMTTNLHASSTANVGLKPGISKPTRDLLSNPSSPKSGTQALAFYDFNLTDSHEVSRR